MPNNFNGAQVLEVGSLDINGSVRRFFTDCNYVGIDVGPGSGVDLVCQGQDFSGPSDSFDTVISCECLEHNPFWLETFHNMVRVCKPGGLVLMTCASVGRGEHGTARTAPDHSPLTVMQGWNYYKNLSERDLRSKLPLEHWFTDFASWTNWREFDLYFAGIKKTAQFNSQDNSSWENIVANVNRSLEFPNASRRGRYVRIAAPILGDQGLNAIRRLRRLL